MTFLYIFEIVGTSAGVTHEYSIVLLVGHFFVKFGTRSRGRVPSAMELLDMGKI